MLCHIEFLSGGSLIPQQYLFKELKGLQLKEEGRKAQSCVGKFCLIPLDPLIILLLAPSVHLSFTELVQEHARKSSSGFEKHFEPAQKAHCF